MPSTAVLKEDSSSQVQYINPISGDVNFPCVRSVKMCCFLVRACGLKTFSVVFKDVPHAFMLILSKPLD